MDCIHPDSIEVIQGRHKARRFITLNQAEPEPLHHQYFDIFGFQNNGNEMYSIPINESKLKELVVYSNRDDQNTWGVAFMDYYLNEPKSETMPTQIKFVHELENLFFALTGDELNKDGWIPVEKHNT